MTPTATPRAAVRRQPVPARPTRPATRPRPRPAPRRAPRSALRRWLGAPVWLLAAACAGPTLQLDSDGPRYVDGRRDARATLPFRYYGTTVVDVLPRDVPAAELSTGADDPELRRPDWTRVPTRTLVDVDPPASPWLFPLDFVVEVVDALVHGAPPAQQARAATAPSPEVVVTGYLPGGVQALRERAEAARRQR